MHRHRNVALVLAVALAAAGAACGGAGKTSHPGAAGTGGHGAEAVPSSALAFVDANADVGSTAWQKMRTVGARIPGWDRLEAQITKGFATMGSDGKGSFAKDVQPWLGDEVAAGLLGITVGTGSPKPQAVAYLASKDDGKARAAIEADGKAKKGAAYKGYDTYSQGSGFAAVGNGAVLIATDERSLEASIDAREGGDQLANAELYKQTLAKLPEDNVLVAYVDGAKLSGLMATVVALAGASGGLGAAGLPTDTLDKALASYQSILAIGIAFGADDHGVRLTMDETTDPTKAAKAGSAGGSTTLLARAPANAVAFVDVAGFGPALDQQIAAYASNPQYQQAVSQLETATGLSLAKDILPLFGNELAAYLSSGAPTSGGVLLAPADATSGAAALRRVTAAVGALNPAVAFAPLPGAADGETASVGSGALSWVHDGDLLAIGFNTNGAVPNGGLASSAAFAGTAKDARLPDGPQVLFYASPSAIATLAPTSSGNAHAIDVAKAIRGVLAWAISSGSESSATLYVDVPPPGS